MEKVLFPDLGAKVVRNPETWCWGKQDTGSVYGIIDACRPEDYPSTLKCHVKWVDENMNKTFDEWYCCTNLLYYEKNSVVYEIF